MRGTSGYSVFEVLIAFAIMSIVLAALLPGQAQLLSRASSDDERLLAYDFALSRLALLRHDPATEFSTSTTGPNNWRVTETQVTAGAGTGSVPEILIIIEDKSGKQLARVSGVSGIRE